MPIGPEVDDLVTAISKLLAGKHPALQGAALSNLVAIWLAGHPKEHHEGLLGLHATTVRKITALELERKRHVH